MPLWRRAVVLSPVLLPVCPQWSPCPAGTCLLGVHLLREGRRIHPKGTWSWLDGDVPTSAFAMYASATWVKEGSAGYSHFSALAMGQRDGDP